MKTALDMPTSLGAQKSRRRVISRVLVVMFVIASAYTTLAQSPPVNGSAAPTLAQMPVGIGNIIDAALARLAIKRAKEGAITPVPLDAGDGVVRGWLLTSYLIGVVQARAAMLAGSPMDEATTSPSLVQNQQPLAIAFPWRCGDRIVPVTDVEVVSPEGSNAYVTTTGAPLSRGALSSRLPALFVPDGAVARSFITATEMQNVVVHVTYGEGCDGQPTRVSLPVTWTQPQAARHISVFKFPPEASALTSPITVQVRGIIDDTGVFLGIAQTTGPRVLERAALALPTGWEFEPARANRVALPAMTTQAVSFNAEGMPASAVLSVMPPPTPPPGVTSADGLWMSAISNGRSTEDFRTPDVRDLTAATSRCEISDDPTYGSVMEKAIRVGGGASSGPARERQYLAGLRGPNGEGTHVVRRGSLRAPDGTILDLYELTHMELIKPFRLYLDEYHSETLKAPQGLVCAASLAK